MLIGGGIQIGLCDGRVLPKVAFKFSIGEEVVVEGAELRATD